MNKILWPGSNLTRETRAKNLLGVSTCRYSRLWGQVGEDNELGDHLAVMPAYEAGNHATIDLIRDHYLILGWFTVGKFGNRWSGDPAGKYGATLARVMRISPTLPLLFKYYGDLLMRGMAIMENGDPVRNIPPGYFGQYINEDL